MTTMKFKDLFRLLKSKATSSIERCLEVGKNYLPSIAIFVGLLLMGEVISNWLLTLHGLLVADMNEKVFASLILSASIIYIISVIYRFAKSQLYISHRTLNYWLCLFGAYYYYRYIDNQYFFWGVDCKTYHFAYVDVIWIILFALCLCKLIRKFCKNTFNVDNTILPDIALNDKAADLFGYNTMACRLLDDLNKTDVREHAFSVGISGQWGSGKSSFLNLMEASILDKKDIVVRFYPRSSSKVELIQDDFLSVFSDVLSKYHTGIPSLIKKYVAALRLLENEGVFNNILNAVESLNADDERERINDALKKIGRRVFVIIEDLDRLTGTELLEVFKLIDKNGDFCNVFYLSAYDKSYVNGVLCHEIGYKVNQDYTDKYFSYEISLPPQKQWVTRNYIRLYLEGHALFNKEGYSKNNVLAEWQKVGATIVRALGTLRHVKRYINLFMSRYPYVCNDVNVGDFMLLTLLRYQNIAIYESIVNLEIVTRGGFLAGSKTTMYLIKDYKKVLEGLNATDEQVKVVETLFPQIREHDYGGGVYKRIRRAEAFDLYFFDQYEYRVYYKDLAPLFEEEDDNKALDRLETLLSNKNNWGSIEEYLRYGEEGWINSSFLLRRYTKLVILTYKIQNRDLNYHVSFGRLFCKNVSKELIQAKAANDETEYKENLKKAVEEMIPRCDWAVGFFMINTLNEFFERADAPDDFILKYPDDYTDIAFKALQCYMDRRNDADWNALTAMQLSMIHPSSGGAIDTRAATLIWNDINTHADDYSKCMVACSIQYYEDPNRLILAFNAPHQWKLAFKDWDLNFKPWLDKLRDGDAKIVLSRMYDANKSSKNVSVSALKESYDCTDFKAMSKAIRNQESLDKIAAEEQQVLDYISAHGPCFKKDISEGLGLNNSSKIVDSLYNQKKIGKEKGKYVSL